MRALYHSTLRFWNSSIGKKITVAVTGLLLVGFLLAHMFGNLLLFVGRDAINSYAEFLHQSAHGVGIWIARIGLLSSFILHIFATISLVLHNKKAKGQPYAYQATTTATPSSRIMIFSGLTVVAFVIYHILRFTVRVDPALSNLPDPVAPERHDVYGMVILGFSNPWVVLFYFVSMTLLCSHLSHGTASIFQTLGLRTRKNADAINFLAKALTVTLWVGFLVVPFSVVLCLITD